MIILRCDRAHPFRTNSNIPITSRTDLFHSNSSFNSPIWRPFSVLALYVTGINLNKSNTPALRMCRSESTSLAKTCLWSCRVRMLCTGFICLPTLVTFVCDGYGYNAPSWNCMFVDTASYFVARAVRIQARTLRQSTRNDGKHPWITVIETALFC